MPWIALAVLIDSVVVLTMGTRLNRTARRESSQINKTLLESGPEVMAKALAQFVNSPQGAKAIADVLLGGENK